MKIGPTIIRFREEVLNATMYVRGLILNPDELDFIRETQKQFNDSVAPIFAYNKPNHLMPIIKKTDNCFVLCSWKHCFAEHQLVLRAEKVYVCVKVQNLGLVNWD